MRRWIFVLPLVLAACDSLLSPGENQSPQLRSVALGAPVMGTNDGFVVLSAIPADLSFRLEPHDRVRVRLTSSSGDEENVALYPFYNCRPWRGDLPLSCFSLSVGLTSAKHRDWLARHIYGRGVITSSWDDVASYSVLYFEPGAIFMELDTLSSRPWVEYVEQWGWLCAGTCTFTQVNATLGRPVRVRRQSPSRFDRVLQVADGDTITAMYEGIVVSSPQSVTRVVDLP